MAPARRARTTLAPHNATTGTATTGKDLKDALWKAADKLRGSMDAAEYKHFVLGLIFLKYVSDAFAERHASLPPAAPPAAIPVPDADTGTESGAVPAAEHAFRGPDDPAAYTGSGVFWVPPGARWEAITRHADASGRGGEPVGPLLDTALRAIAATNPPLAHALPVDLFTVRGVDNRRLGELVGLIDRIGFGDQLAPDGRRRSARDVLGEVYEYCLARFAAAEGRRGGEYFTPACVVRLLVEVVEPRPGERVYDPACGSGGMFVQAEKFIESHGGCTAPEITVHGQELNQHTWRLAGMNLAIHGIAADLGSRWGDVFHDDRHPGLRADVVMANPPFNISDWGGEQLADDPRWRYGTPPPGNANYAWLQHMAAKLAPGTGRAGIVLANGSMSSEQSGEGAIRRAMVEDDVVACMVALPGRLFRSTQIPVCLWFLARDKSPRGEAGYTDRRGQILFIDARGLGEMVGRTERELTPGDISRIAGTYHAWRGTPSARERRLAYEDVPGFCRSAGPEEIRAHDYVLTPGRYVGSPEPGDATDDGGAAEDAVESIARLRKELFAHFEESARREAVVRAQWGGIGG
ncbi:N-6 DNA methylase [Streptomyces sp. NPDC050560]|uniref:type I restriction-modification system subunit M n=1 Tax=Streptomyces sp. NPDC050560 TaxID=3365630 RepID=UPI0037B2B448